MLEIGSLVDGKYKVLSEIGHGGMSIVYLAIVERANQTWAIKEVRKNGATKDDIVEQGLVAEMNILKRLNHSHRPRISDIIDYEDSFLIVMDYIEGVDLDKKLREGPQKWEDVLEWSKQLCDVLAYLHSRTPPIIYRDMKPGNVKLKPDGDVVLFDFGTAREYKSQKAGDDTTCLGTRGYASPEQYGGMGQTDARSDIYCLGATMFHLITGRIPGGPPDYTTPPIRSICPWLPRSGLAGRYVRGLEYIIIKCMQQNPANRYQNCAELMYDLENAEKLSDTYIRELKRKRNVFLASAISSVVCAALAVGLSIGATRSIETTYNDLVNKNEGSIAVHMSATNDGYDKIEKNLKEAIDLDPARLEAWLYLSRLYRSDNSITEQERVNMKWVWDTYSDQLYASPGHYAQFCFEWGSDLFFLYDNSEAKSAASGDESAATGSVVNKGSPDKAEPFLRIVVNGKDSSMADKTDELTAYLVNDDLDDKLLKGPNGEFKLKTFNKEQAELVFNFSKTLHSLASNWSMMDRQGGDLYSNEGNSYINVWTDLKALVGNAGNVSNMFDGANNKLVQASIYNLTENLLHDRFTALKTEGNVAVEEIKKLSEQIRTDARTLQGSIQEESLKLSLQPIFRTIETVCDSVLDLCNTYR